jgi:hypothetical protein
MFGWVINQDVHFELKLVGNRVDKIGLTTLGAIMKREMC